MIAALYNEIEPYAAAWLGNLSTAGHIAPGSVDARSIRDLRADDVVGAVQFHTFAGLGAWSYALRLAGWPDDRPVWTGSCPCQPFSDAGKGAGFSDPRHLWPEWFRLIRECRPPVVFGEQVASRAGLDWLAAVRADLEGEGYAVGAADLCAAGVGAPHIRQRLFFGAVRLADAEHDGHRQHRGCVGSAPGSDPREGDQRQRLRADPADGGAVGDVADPGRPRLSHAEPATLCGARWWQEGRATGERRVPPAGWLADTVGEQWREVGALPGRSDRGSPAQGLDERPADRSPWHDPDWLYCRDGKWRPTQPGLRPLVDRFAPGVAGVRAGSLKAYGNAIVPQVAAQFVAAFCASVAA